MTNRYTDRTRSIAGKASKPIKAGKAMKAHRAVRAAAASEKAAKVPNYTPEQAQSIAADYLAGVTPENIGKTMGKSTRSIVAKLSRIMGADGKTSIYKAKSYVTKAGTKPVSKDLLSDQIGALTNPPLTESQVESLTKVNKTALAAILDRMTKPVSAVEAQGQSED